MSKRTHQAFVKKSEETAKEVILSDKRSNNLRNLVVKELINDYMVKDSSTVSRAVPLLLITRDLESICDHAASIAEDVIYMIQAKVIKHHRERLTAIDVKDIEEG